MIYFRFAPLGILSTIFSFLLIFLAFDVIVIVKVVDSQIIDPGMDIIVRYDNYTAYTSRTVSAKMFWSKPTMLASEYCRNFSENPEFISRCYSSIAHSIRNFKIVFANKIQKTLHEQITRQQMGKYEYSQCDGVLYAMSYIYDYVHAADDTAKYDAYSSDTAGSSTIGVVPNQSPNNAIDGKESHNVCIFGDFSLKISLLSVMSNRNSTLWLFLNRPRLETDEYTMSLINLMLSIMHESNVKTHVLFAGNTNANTRGIHSSWKSDFNVKSRSCDIIHLRSNMSHVDIIELVQTFTTSSKNSVVRKDSHSYVIWERTAESTQAAEVSSAEEGSATPISSSSSSSSSLDMTTENTNDLIQRFSNPWHRQAGLLWEASIKWPERSTISGRADPHGYLQQFYDISHNEGTIDTWLGMFYHHDSQSRAAVPPPPLSASSYEAQAAYAACNTDLLQRFLVVITYTNQIFSDNALGLKRALEKLQPPAVANIVTIGDFNYYDLKLYLGQYLLCHQLKVLQSTRASASGATAGDGHLHSRSLPHIDDLFDNQYYTVIQIAIGAHEPALLLKHYIPFDVEQVWSLFMQFDTYEFVLRGALAVFTMSKQHSEKLKSSIKGIDKSKFYNIPLYSTTSEKYYSKQNGSDDAVTRAVSLTQRLASVFGANQNKEAPSASDRVHYNKFIYESHEPQSLRATQQQLDPSRPPADRANGITVITEVDMVSVVESIDVLFFGSCGPHRRLFMQRFHAQHLVHTARGRGRPLRVMFKCLTDWTAALLDEERDFYVKKSRLVVNIHQTENSSLETHRITYLLSLGKCVLTERSTFDPILDAEYENAVVYGDNLDDIIDKIFELLEQPESIKRCQQQAEMKFRQIDSDVDSLQRAMIEITSKL